MKMKKVKEVCKRIGVGLLSAALLLTGGSFSQVRSAKASGNLGQYFNFIVFANWNDESTGCETGQYNSDLQDRLKTDATAYNTTFSDGSYIHFVDFTSEMGANAEGSRKTIVGYKFQAWIDPSGECEDSVIAECDSVINKGRIKGIPLFICDTKGYAVTDSSIAMTETSDDFMSSSEYLMPTPSSNYNKFYVTYSKISYNILYGGGIDVTGLPTDKNGIYASDSYVIPKNIPSRSGYDFLGYSTDANATTASYQPGDKIKVSDLVTDDTENIDGADLYLHPVWKSKSNVRVEISKSGLCIDNNSTMDVAGTSSHTDAVYGSNYTISKSLEPNLSYNHNEQKYQFKRWNISVYDNTTSKFISTGKTCQTGDKFLLNSDLVPETALNKTQDVYVITLIPVYEYRTYGYTATVKDMCGDTELGSKQIATGSRKYNQPSPSYSGRAAGTQNGSYPGYKLKSYGTGAIGAGITNTSLVIVNQWEVCDHSGHMTYTKNEDGSTHSGVCDVCGFVKNNASCNFELKNEVDATCETQSTETYECTQCGGVKVTHKKAATGHSYTLMNVKADALYQAATCTTAPKYYYSCANCGKVEGDANHVFSNGDALGHDYQTVYEDNNGIHNGKESKVCSRCHDEKDVKYLLYIDPLDAIKNDVAFTSGFGYYSKGQQVQVQGLANVNKTIGYGTPYYVYNDKKLDISTGIITMPDHAISVSLTADLEIYNLNFVVPHGWMTVPTQNFKYGEGVSTLAMPAMDTGYQFLGWYDNKDCTGEPVTSVAATEHADKTLYGKTEVITYNIDYEFGGTKGIGIDSIKVDDSAVKSYNIESKKIMLPTADEIELVGDTVNTDKVEFDGWYDDASLESDAKVTSIDTGSFGDKVLYAKYDVVDSGEDSTPTPPAVTATPSPTPTVTPSVKPTATPSVTPTATPSITPTVKPSASPSISPSTKPSSSPSSAPTIKPSDSPNPTVKPQETADTKPQTTSDAQATPSMKPVTVSVVSKGGITYKVKGKSCVVTKCKKKIKKAVIQKKVKFVINGKTVTYKVTGIQKNAFKNCKKLKSLTIKSTTIKKIAKNTFKGVSKKCKVKVPKKQFKKYRKLLKKAKFKGKVKK